MLFGSAYLVLTGRMTVVKFVVFYTYASQFSFSIKEIARINNKVQQSEVSFSRIKNINFDDSNKEEHILQTKTLDNVNSVEMENVTFGYTNDQKIISDINLQFKDNSFTAIVGPSGNGKSTILHLLNRLYDDYNGNIRFGNVNLRDVEEKSLRKSVTRVFQEPLLFNTTIYQNLQIVNKEASKEEIEKCCKQAFIHDYIMSLPNGYDTTILENSNNISVGQKQRLAIARALLIGAKVLLFDEIT